MTKNNTIKTKRILGVKFNTMIGKEPFRIRISMIMLNRHIDILLIPSILGFGLSITENLKKWDEENGFPRNLFKIEKSL